MRGERGASLRSESSPKARSTAGSSRPDSGAGGSNAVFVVGHASPPCVSCRCWRIHFARFKRAEVAIVGKPPPAGQVILRGVFCLGFANGKEQGRQVDGTVGAVPPFICLRIAKPTRGKCDRPCKA